MIYTKYIFVHSDDQDIFITYIWTLSTASGLQLPSPSAAAKSLQSCLTLCDPTDGSPPGFPVPEILQARTLEWVAISFSNAGKWKVKVKLLSRVELLATAWTAACQAPPSMGFSRQKYWSGVPSPSPEKRLITSKFDLNSRCHSYGFCHLDQSWRLKVAPSHKVTLVLC